MYTNPAAFCSNPVIESSKLFTKEAIKLYQEVFVWAADRVMHRLHDFSIAVPYLFRHVPQKFANAIAAVSK